MELSRPQVDTWLEEIKAGAEGPRIGMYLIHNGVVRGTARDGTPVNGMDLDYDGDRLEEVLDQVSARPGVAAVKVWVNRGRLQVGDDIMLALVAGDIRENVFSALQELVRAIKTEVVREWEIK